MSILSADIDIDRGEDTMIEVPVTDDEIIYKGALVCIDTDGYALAAADTADYKFIGIAYDKQDNTVTNHADGFKKVRVYRRGIFKLTCTGITQAMVGQLMYITDDQTIDNTSTNWICCGRLVKYVDANTGWVDIGDKSVEPTVSYMDNVELAFGNDQDIVMDWDGTNFSVVPAADGSRVLFGSDSYKLHLRFGNSAHLEFYDANNYIYGNGAGQIIIVASNATAAIVFSPTSGYTQVTGALHLTGAIFMDTDSARINLYSTTEYLYANASGQMVIVATGATAAICLMPTTGYVYISSDVTMLNEKKLFLNGTTDYIYCNSAGQVHIVGSNATAAIVFAPTSGYTQVTGSIHVTGAIFMDTDSQRINLYSTTEYLYANAAGQIVIVSAGVSTGAIYLQCPSGGATINGTLNVQDDQTMADDKKIYLYSTTDYIHANSAGQIIIVGSNETAAICLMPSGANAYIYLNKCLALANLASGIAVAGALWFDTSDNKLHFYNGSAEETVNSST